MKVKNECLRRETGLLLIVEEAGIGVNMGILSFVNHNTALRNLKREIVSLFSLILLFVSLSL
jgi:hypothetical protein